MTELTHRERLLKALAHEEPDRVPFDLCGTHVTAIAAGAYRRLREYLGLPEETPAWLDVVQQVVVPGEDVYGKLGIDTRGLYPLTSHNWNVWDQLEDGGEKWVYHDEWGLTQHFPKSGGLWFNVAVHPLEDQPPETGSIENHSWPDAADRRRVAGLREKAEAYRAAGYPVMIKGICAGIFEMAQRLRGMENTLMDPLVYPEFSDRLHGRLADLKIAFWEMALAELGDTVDVAVESDDYGTQQSQLISHEQFRQYLRPHLARVFAAIKKAAPHVKLFFHSCGNVRPFLPDFIEDGIDILNPVHISAAGMAPVALKKDFGDAVTFWGGGVETQDILPNGTPDLIRENVRRNLDALAPGGGYVFTTVHNIQSEVPPENIVAMWEAMREFGAY
jgi:uroporphyrinogen decarboxylase